MEMLNQKMNVRRCQSKSKMHETIGTGKCRTLGAYFEGERSVTFQPRSVTQVASRWKNKCTCSLTKQIIWSTTSRLIKSFFEGSQFIDKNKISKTTYHCCCYGCYCRCSLICTLLPSCHSWCARKNGRSSESVKLTLLGRCSHAPRERMLHSVYCSFVR